MSCVHPVAAHLYQYNTRTHTHKVQHTHIHTHSQDTHTHTHTHTLTLTGRSVVWASGLWSPAAILARSLFTLIPAHESKPSWGG
jgi:hypothetical protein